MREQKEFNVAILGEEESAGVIRDFKEPHPYEREFSIFKVVAIWDANEEYARTVEASRGVPYRPLEDILNDPTIDIIQNDVMGETGDKLSKMILEHGKHLSTVKYLAYDFERGKELIRIAREKGLRITTNPDCVLGANMQTARYIVDHGIIGKVNSGVISFSRDNRVIAENLPYLYEPGGNVLWDMSGYYLYSLVNILGPVRSVKASCVKTHEPHRIRKVNSPLYGETIQQEDYDILTAIFEFESGALVTVHLNSSTLQYQRWVFDLFGEDGVISMNHPHDFYRPVYVQKNMPGATQVNQEPFEFPLCFGFTDWKHFGGLGIAEMCWAIVNNRPHRVNEEFSLHMLELAWAIEESGRTGETYQMTTTTKRIPQLPQGYTGNGFYTIDEESALAYPVEE